MPWAPGWHRGRVAELPPWLQIQSVAVIRANDSLQRLWTPTPAVQRNLTALTASAAEPGLVAGSNTLWWQSFATRCHCRNTRATQAAAKPVLYTGRQLQSLECFTRPWIGRHAVCSLF